MPGFGQIGIGDAGLWVWAIPFAFGLLAAGAAYVLYTRGGHPLLWRGGAIALAALVAGAVVHTSAEADRTALRRMLEARSAELTARALAPGSPLACLDGLANAALETGCEKALFAHPETLAAAVAYVDARLSLVLNGLVLAGRDRTFAEQLERTRRALEADRFGVVAHVLTTRGCTTPECAAFKALRDTGQVAANIKDRTFDAQVALYSGGWTERPTLASVPAVTSPTAISGDPADASAPGGVPVSSKYDFPSAASIPPVSIMDPEPSRPAAAAAPRQQAAPRAAARSAPQQKPEDNPAPPTVITPPSSTGAR